MSRRPVAERLSVSEDIRRTRERNNIRKQEILDILKIEDNNYSLYELEQKLCKIRSDERRIREREIRRANMLYSLRLDKDTHIDDDELERLYQESERESECLYQERLLLRERLKKQRDDFNISQYRKKYPENNSTTTDYFTSYNMQSHSPSFHNPGGATIYTQENAANTMVFNEESGIYEPGEF